MKKLLLLLAVAVFASCGGGTKTPPAQFSHYGVSFDVPEGWKIDDETDYEEGYYVSVEKSGFSESGILVVTWLDSGLISPEEFLEMNKEGLAEQKLFKKLSFSDVQATRYGEYDAIYVSYTARVLTVEHRGAIYAFSQSGKTICVLQQESLDDASANRRGFEELERSFRVADDETESEEVPEVDYAQDRNYI